MITQETPFGERFLDGDEVLGLILEYLFNDRILWWMKRLHFIGVFIALFIFSLFDFFRFDITSLIYLFGAALLGLLIRFAYQGMSLVLDRIKRPFPKISAQSVKKIPCFKCSNSINNIDELMIAKVQHRPQPFHQECHKELWENINMRTAMHLEHGQTSLPSNFEQKVRLSHWPPVLCYYLLFVSIVVSASLVLDGFMDSFGYAGDPTPYLLIALIILFPIMCQIAACIVMISIVRIKKIYLLLNYRGHSNQ